jgi:hypothetical protein
LFSYILLFYPNIGSASVFYSPVPESLVLF